jgi:hypothetical protein
MADASARRSALAAVGSVRQCAVVSDHEIHRHRPFPFPGDEFPSDLGAAIQATVLSGDEPAREVIHASDGSWLVGDGVNDPNRRGAIVIAHMSHVVERNSSVKQLATMPPGHVATRAGPGEPWVITRHEWST